MAEKYSVKLSKIIETFGLEVLYLPEHEVYVENMAVLRPGLVFTGFYGHYDNTRIQIIGLAEHEYLAEQPDDIEEMRFRDFMATKPVAVVITTGQELNRGALEGARENEVPLLRTELHSNEFTTQLTAWLQVQLAPRITRHGVLVEIYGEGVLLLGDSGIGKSETAIELVKRGHRLIADDAVEIKRMSSKTLVGSAPEIIKHYVELRGIGIVDVSRLFGVGAVKDTERIDLIVNLEPWVQGKMYDRLGLEDVYTDIMGIKIPTTVIPVKPGRNLAIIIEIAAMNNRQKQMGYNTAEEFNRRLIESMNIEEEE